MDKPFDKSYVLRTTTKYMRKAIDISIRKTYDRVSEFGENLDKSREVFETLAVLHELRKQLDSFQLENKEAFSTVKLLRK